MCKYLWGINMKVLLDHLIQESGQERQFGCLSETCCDSSCQLGVLTSESFSKRMTGAANLIVDTHRLYLNDELIEKMIVLRMSKRFMERVRTKNVFL